MSLTFLPSHYGNLCDLPTLMPITHPLTCITGPLLNVNGRRRVLQPCPSVLRFQMTQVLVGLPVTSTHWFTGTANTDPYSPPGCTCSSDPRQDTLHALSTWSSTTVSTGFPLTCPTHWTAPTRVSHFPCLTRWLGPRAPGQLANSGAVGGLTSGNARLGAG